MDWQWIGRLAMYRLIGKLIDRLAMDWWIGAGLTLDFQIGHGLVIGIGGLVMDWRIGPGLTSDWWIGDGCTLDWRIGY